MSGVGVTEPVDQGKPSSWTSSTASSTSSMPFWICSEIWSQYPFGPVTDADTQPITNSSVSSPKATNSSAEPESKSIGVAPINLPSVPVVPSVPISSQRACSITF